MQDRKSSTFAKHKLFKDLEVMCISEGSVVACMLERMQPIAVSHPTVTGLA